MATVERVPCPDCGNTYAARGLGTHRRIAHGRKAVNGRYGLPGNRLSDETKDRIVEAARQPGATRNGVAKQIGVSPSSVTGVCQRAGLTFDRSGTATATEARKVDNAARRAELAAGLLDDVAKLRAQLFAPTTLHAFGGKDNVHNSVDIEEPLYADKLKIVQAAGAAIDRHLKLDAHDSDKSADDAKALLTGLGHALGITDGP